MLTFAQFLKEYYTVWKDWGLVHPNGSTISGPNHRASTHSHLSAIKKIKTPEHYADFGVDKKTGELTLRTYGKRSLNGAMKALASGKVRSHNGQVYHYHADDALGHESEHSGDIADIHQRAKHLHQKLYKSSLKEAILVEAPDYYKNFGWIKPDGSYHDGAKFPKAKSHQEILPKHLRGRHSEDYGKAFAAGWVRHGQMKYDGSHMFHSDRMHRGAVKAIDGFMASPHHEKMGGNKYRWMADGPSYREVIGHSQEHFLNTLHN